MAEYDIFSAINRYADTGKAADYRAAESAIKNKASSDATKREALELLKRHKKKKEASYKRGDFGDMIPGLVSERGLEAFEKRAPKLLKTMKNFVKFESDIIKFGAQTGAQAANITRTLTALQRSNQHLGITTKSTMGAMTVALKQYAGTVTPAWQKDNLAITKQIAVFDKLGISTGTTITTMNTFSAVLGRSRGEVTRTAGVLNKFAQETGQGYNRVWQDFNKNVGSFMDILNTEEMTRQTLLFNVRARRMGIDVGAVMSNLERFETLDSAQAAAGKINAVMSSLGGSFDAVKAASMDYPERMEYIAQSIQSVMGRVEASGPRASRAYMKAMKSAFGLDSKTFRALISYKPGQALPAELAMGQGLIGGLTTAATERVAAEAATIEERTMAMADARESFAYHVIPTSLGLAAQEIISKIKVRSGELDTTLIKIGEGAADQVGKKISETLTAVMAAMTPMVEQNSRATLRNQERFKRNDKL